MTKHLEGASCLAIQGHLRRHQIADGWDGYAWQPRWCSIGSREEPNSLLVMAQEVKGLVAPSVLGDHGGREPESSYLLVRRPSFYTRVTILKMEQCRSL